MSLFNPRKEKRAVTWASLWGSDTEMPSNTYSGKPVSETSALKLSTVWAAATLVADAIAGLLPEAVTFDPITGKIERVELPQWVRKPHPDRKSVV
jgi:hypothetical protein